MAKLISINHDSRDSFSRVLRPEYRNFILSPPPRCTHITVCRGPSTGVASSYHLKFRSTGERLPQELWLWVVNEKYVVHHFPLSRPIHPHCTSSTGFLVRSFGKTGPWEVYSERGFSVHTMAVRRLSCTIYGPRWMLLN